MVRELMVFRHGQAQDYSPTDVPEYGYGPDFVRELHDKGKRNAQRVGVWMARNDLRPDYVVSSPATRAKRTAQKSCKTAGLNSDIVAYDERIYEATVEDLLEVIRSAPKAAKRILLVGHNPGLEDLVRKISKGSVPRTKRGAILPPATLAYLTVEGDWKDVGNNSGECVEVVRPKKLPRTFPFPDLDSEEQRCRPSYYYSQSSVVPYRVKDGALEVLVISSSKQKHWVIPKGIHDPGMTAQESAANEAFEEAGVLGVVGKKAIGAYSYAKWDATCTVTVFPMKVTRELPEDEWAERHRGRQWVSVDTAAQMVLNDDVKKMVALLPSVLPKTTSSRKT